MSKFDLIQFVLYFFELLACVTGFIYWKKIKDTHWRWFPIYLAIIVVTEITGKILLSVLDETQLNVDLYTYFGIPIQFLFFFWLFHRYFSTTKQNKWPLIGAAIYILSWITEMVFFTKTANEFWFMSFSYTIGNIVLLVLSILFFIRFVNSEAILKYKQSMMFWVCLGLLAFYLGTFPFYALRNTLVYEYPKIFEVYYYVNFGLDYLMYILFTIAFIWGRPK